MKIYCPKCHTCYSIETGLIPPDGKKLRCSRCGEIWLCTHKDMEDAETAEKETPQNVIANSEDAIIATPAPETAPVTETAEAPLAKEATLTEDEMNLIFSRLKEESNKLDTEKEGLSSFKKTFLSLKKILGWDSYLTISLEILTILIILCLSILGNRYALVRKFPQLEYVFSQIGMPSRVIGEGLEFQNIVRSYDNPDKPKLLTIKGFIYNTTPQELKLPLVLVKAMNNDAVLLKDSTHQLEKKSIPALDKYAFTLQVKVPKSAKYIMLTFTE